MDTTKKELLKKNRKGKTQPATAFEGDPYSQASIDAGSLEDVGDQSVFGQPSTMRQGFFNEMKKKSRLGKLTPEMYRDAKEQLGKYEGISGDQFDSTMRKNLIRPSNFAGAPATSSPEEATQNVMFQKQYGSGLGALAAMQDPNYELGSGSSLRQPARSIGTKSGALKRASRRLRRKGYGAQAGQMAMASEIQRLKEPSISSDATRAADMARRIEAGRLKQQQDQLMSKRDSLFSKLLDKMPSMGGDKGEVEELKTETASRSADAEKRRKERQSLFGNRLNATRNT